MYKDSLVEAILSSSEDGIIFVDPETGLPLRFNAQAHEHLGYSREEFAQIPVSQYEVLPDVDKNAKRKQDVQNTGGTTFQTRHLKKRVRFWMWSLPAEP